MPDNNVISKASALKGANTTAALAVLRADALKAWNDEVHQVSELLEQCHAWGKREVQQR